MRSGRATGTRTPQPTPQSTTAVHSIAAAPSDEHLAIDGPGQNFVDRTRPRRETAVGLGAVVVAMGLWWWATQTVRPERDDRPGVALGLPGPVRAGVRSAGSNAFVTLNVRRRSPEWLLAVVLVAIIVAIHAFTPVAYGTLRYSWAWKHLGVIDFIDRTGTVDRDSRYLDAYHNWPGFFAGSSVHHLAHRCPKRHGAGPVGADLLPAVVEHGGVVHRVDVHP